MKSPVEASTYQRRGLVHKGIMVDDVNDGDSNVRRILLDSGQNWFQPSCVHLTMTVKKYQHLQAKIQARLVKYFGLSILTSYQKKWLSKEESD